MRLLPIALSAIAAFLLATPAQTQQPVVTPSLDQVLTGVHNNTKAFLALVPDLIADEHVVSKSGAGVMRHIGDATTDYIFRLRRDTSKRDQPLLVESHDAKPTTAGIEQRINGQSVTTGLFSSGTMAFSPELKRCYVYQLRAKPHQFPQVAALVVEYARKKRRSLDPGCLINEPVSGRVFVDPTTMQVLRVEQKLPQHELVPRRVGSWSWSIDYAQIDLDGKSFWLPHTISSNSSLPPGPPYSVYTHWSLVATYRNYHLLEVHSTILPVATPPVP